MQIRIKKLHPDAALPVYAHGPEEDAGLDLRAVESVVLSPGVAQGVPTGIAIELPPGYEAQVRPRSSQVPNPIAGILAPLASTYCMAVTQTREPVLCLPVAALPILPTTTAPV